MSERQLRKRPAKKDSESDVSSKPKKPVPVKGIEEPCCSEIRKKSESTGKSKVHNILDCLFKSRAGENVNREFSEVRKSCLINQIFRFRVLKAINAFHRRVTSVAWHPSYPDIVAAASKGGELAWYNLKTKESKCLPGIGPGGSIVGLKFDRDHPSTVYTASIEGNIKKIDIEKEEETIYIATTNPDDWFSSLDLSVNQNVLISGDSRGNVYIIKKDEQGIVHSKSRFHKSKVTHIEFSSLDPNIFVSSSIDQTVKVWDFRRLSDSKPVHTFCHKKGVNSACFSPSDRLSILTTDQHSEIRIYRSPNWESEQIVQHPHRQFQHLTPIKATWHPLEDLFIVGRYPDDQVFKNDTRTLDVYDGKNGVDLQRIPSPTHGILCLNAFNVTGDAMISSSGSSVMFWKEENMLSEYR